MNAISTYLSVQWLRCVSIFFLGSFLYPMPAMADDACADVVVYGGTPAGIMAAVAAARHGQTVLLVEPGYFVG